MPAVKIPEWALRAVCLPEPIEQRVEGLVDAATDNLALDALVALFELVLHRGRQLAIRGIEAVALLAVDVLTQQLGIGGERVSKLGKLGPCVLIAHGKPAERRLNPGDGCPPSRVLLKQDGEGRLDGGHAGGLDGGEEQLFLLGVVAGTPPCSERRSAVAFMEPTPSVAIRRSDTRREIDHSSLREDIPGALRFTRLALEIP